MTLIPTEACPLASAQGIRWSAEANTWESGLPTPCAFRGSQGSKGSQLCWAYPGGPDQESCPYPKPPSLTLHSPWEAWLPGGQRMAR